MWRAALVENGADYSKKADPHTINKDLAKEQWSTFDCILLNYRYAFLISNETYAQNV